ncbi:hypothetical protein ABZX92_43525 [Lentzea sp. NPDC006480]|uniref:hypothetical protein n=1 Tax=Lentzea sp. NPDC006480 TaxID=3157176 RepID=UPI0033A3B30B
MEMVHSDDEGLTLSLTKEEFFTLIGSINEALELVDDWEFETRVGVARDFAVALRSTMSDLAHGL